MKSNSSNFPDSRLKTTEEPKEICIAHSPDADDRFMFWALREGFVKSPRFSFTWREADTQTLNNIALAEPCPEVCAISAIHYLHVSQKYQPLKMGCSVGNNYGPVIVAEPWVKKLLQEGLREALSQTVFLSPGTKTTAHHVAAILNFGLAGLGQSGFPKIEEVPISPMSLVFERLAELSKQKIPAIALLIHEGRLIYQNFGLDLVLDLGKVWHERFHCSLPLGINVISRRLPLLVREELAKLFKESFDWGQAHRLEFAAETQKSSSPYKTHLNQKELLEYLDLYANETTGNVTEADKLAFETLFREAASQKGVIACDWI